MGPDAGHFADSLGASASIHGQDIDAGGVDPICSRDVPIWGDEVAKLVDELVALGTYL